MKILSVAAICAALLFSVNVYAAKPFIAEAKCPVQILDPALAPAKLPDYIYGQASHSNKEQACVDAKRIATQKFPRGTKPKHCRCIYK